MFTRHSDFNFCFVECVYTLHIMSWGMKNVTTKTVKMGTFVYKTYGELSTHLSQYILNLSSPYMYK